MTSSQARSAANVLLTSVGVAAAIVVLTNPPLRRLALQATKWWLGASLPGYLASELGRGWRASAARPAGST